MLVVADAERFQRELRPGDVLVYDSTSFDAGLVQWGDRVPVNHASLLLDADEIVEANRWGDDDRLRAVRTVPLAQRLSTTSVRTTTALRHIGIGPGGADSTAVTDRAREYLHSTTAFAYLEVVALAPAALRRSYAHDVDRSRALARAALLLLDIAAAASSRAIDSGARALSCSEFVFRCFDESGDDRLKVDVQHRLLGPEGPPSWLSQQADEEIDALHAAVRLHNDAFDTDDFPRAYGQDADRVTPGDLWRSSSLQPVIALHRPPQRPWPPHTQEAGL